MKQLGTINFWPKKTFLATIILPFYTVVNLCSRSKKLYCGRNGDMGARANFYF